MDDAVMAGIIKPGEGVYVNLVTSEKMYIPEAMAAGLIKVSFTTTRRSRVGVDIKNPSKMGYIFRGDITNPEGRMTKTCIKVPKSHLHHM